MTHRCPSLLALVLGLGLGAAPASAGNKAADALFKKGKQAMTDKDYATACAAFAESQRLEPAIGTLLNLGLCLEEAGKLGQALRAFREAEAAAQKAGDERAEKIAERVASLVPDVPVLVLYLPGHREPPPGLVVKIDGNDLTEPLGEPEPLDPGRHRVTYRVGDGPEQAFEIAVDPGDQIERKLPVAMPPKGGKPAEAAAGATAAGDGPARVAAKDPGKAPAPAVTKDGAPGGAGTPGGTGEPRAAGAGDAAGEGAGADASGEDAGEAAGEDAGEDAGEGAEDEDGAAPGAATPNDAPEAPAGGWRALVTRRRLAYGAGGLGALGLGVGSALALSARSSYHDAVDAHCDGAAGTCDATGVRETRDARHLANTATVVFTLGLAAVGAGAYLYLTEPHRATGEGHAIYVTPVVGDGGAALVVGGRL